LSVLDLSPISSDQSSTEALAATVAAAQHAERLGYRRFWVAEHHNAAGLASGSPEVLLAHLGAHTETIRLGAGGIMLPNHAPLRIAEAFRLLEALNPGRIDLGLGRAPGTDHLTAYALRRSREALSGDDYPQLLAELLAFDDESFPDDHPFRAISPTPADVPLPPVFLLGSSLFSAELAAQAGLGLAFAAHIGGDTAIPAMTAYRREFSPSDRYAAPYSILTVGVTTGDTEEEVADLTHYADLMILRLVRGERGARPTREQARAYQFTDADRAAIRRMPGRRIVGTPDAVAAEISSLADQTQADEVMLMTMVPDLDVRLRTLERMAEQLSPATVPA
jgi:luciferase family oxidoreductase group 1